MIKIMKWAGLLGAVLTGAAAIAHGDVTSGVGIIAASLSSLGVLEGGAPPSFGLAPIGLMR